MRISLIFCMTLVPLEAVSLPHGSRRSYSSSPNASFLLLLHTLYWLSPQTQSSLVYCVRELKQLKKKSKQHQSQGERGAEAMLQDLSLLTAVSIQARTNHFFNLLHSYPICAFTFFHNNWF